MYCGKCGKTLEEEWKICPYCSSSNENNTNIHIENNPLNYAENNPENNPEVIPEDNPANYPEDTLYGIVLTEEEKIIRTYLCSQLRFPSCEGYLSVTNRRVIFHGYGGNSRIVDEVPLDSVSAISTFYGTRTKIGQIIIGLIFVISSFVAFANSSPRSYYDDTNPIAVILGLVLLFSGIILLATSIKRAFVLKIYSSSANNSPIDIGAGPGGLAGNSVLFSVLAQATEQTDQMMLELGAMISELQRLGDHGVEQWKR